MKLITVSLLAAVVVGVESFFFSLPQSPQDCDWLPWEYVSCKDMGSDQYRKLEQRRRVPLHGGATCDDAPQSRTSDSCTKAEFFASTILGTIKNRGQHYKRITSLFRSGDEDRPPQKDCRRTIRDEVSGVEMLGDDDCGTRGRRSIETLTSARSRVKRQFPNATVPSIDHRDILFLLDESGSVTGGNFNKQIKFVEVLSEKFSYPRQISRDATQVAVTTFASNYRNRIHFADTTNFKEFRDRLKKVTFGGGNTCMIRTLEGVKTEVFQGTTGSRIRSAAVDGLIILVTDGCFNCHGGNLKSSLQKQQKELEDIGVTIVTFMVNVDNSCKASLRALKDGSSCFQGYSFPSWEEFDNMIENIRMFGSAIDRWTKVEEACP